MIKDYYYLLGLPRTARLDEIKQAYRRLAAQCHPDRVAGQGQEALAQATTKMTELNEAFKTLSNPARKAEYDQLVDLIPERPLPKAGRSATASAPPSAAASAPPKPDSGPAPAEQRVATAPASPGAAPAAATPPRAGRRAPMPRPEARLDPEYGTRVKAAVSRMSLKWTEHPLRGWDWALEAAKGRRGLLVLYRGMESLSLLSARALQRVLGGLREQRKSPLRKTILLAVVHIGRLMDAQAVHEQLQALAVSEGGLLGSVQSLVVLREGKNRPVVFGAGGEDAQAAEVLRIVQAVN